MIDDYRVPSHFRLEVVRDLAALGIFLALIVFFTWPGVLSLSDSIIGGFFTLGHLWSWDLIVRGIIEKGTILTNTLAIHYPVGTSLNIIGWSYIIIILPLQVLGVGLISATNLALILHMLIACYFAYRLAVKLTGRWAPSVVGGIAYGFSAFALSLLWNGQLPKLTLGFLPLIVLLVIKIAEVRRVWPSIVLGFVFALLIASCPYNGILGTLLALITGSYLLFRSMGTGRVKGIFLRLCLGALAAVILTIPFLLFWYSAKNYPEMISVLQPSEISFQQNPSLLSDNATLAGWFAPGKPRVNLSNLLKLPVYHVHYLGWTLIFFAMSAFIFNRKRNKDGGKKDDETDDPRAPREILSPGFFLATGVLFFVIAHGYYLRPSQEFIISPIVKLPLYWLYKIFPGVIAFSVTYRAAVGVYLCAAVLAAIGLCRIGQRVGRTLGYVLCLIAGLGILTEVWLLSPTPFPVIAGRKVKHVAVEKCNT